MSIIAIGRTSAGVASHWIGSSMMPDDCRTLLMIPLRSNSQRQERPMAMLPLTAGTKYRARKMWIPRSARLTTIASTIESTIRIGVTSR